MEDNSRYVKVATKDLRIGMYVVELDRPWLDTPFLVQGFVIQSIDELEILLDLCTYVYVDNGRSIRYHKPVMGASGTGARGVQKQLRVRTQAYADTRSFRDELTPAKRAYDDYESMVNSFYDDVRRHDKLDIQQVKGPVAKVVESVIRNPDACMLLAKIKKRGGYSYDHAIGCAVWASAFGRELGLPKQTLLSVATGAMLLDVGKIKISDRLLNKGGKLSPPEMVLAKSHVIKSMKMLETATGVDNITHEMVATHHERHNGKGYPQGLKGNEIPVYGRIAGIVDAYDALISDKPYRLGVPPGDAIKALYNVKGVDFQGELVEVFIQALGLYPAGSLVELSTGEVGIVVSEHRHRRLRPRLLILLDKDKNKLNEHKYLDLFEVTHNEAGKAIDIVKPVSFGAYNIDPENILI